MRIFYAADSTPSAQFDSQLWRINLCLPLKDLGHEIVEFDFNLRPTFQNLNPKVASEAKFIQTNREQTASTLLKQIQRAHSEKPIDLFFSYFTSACITSEVLHEIKRMGIKTMNWYCNAAHQFELIEEIAPHYDWCLVPERFRMPDYERIGANPIYCQEAANPNFYKPHDLPVDIDVSFVGQPYGDRVDHLGHLVSHGISVHLRGAGWKKLISRKLLKLRYQYLSQRKWPQTYLGDLLSDEDLVKFYSRSKINLGFSSCGETHLAEKRILQIRLRDFEVPMSGGFYMVEYMAELEEFFNIGTEVVCYRSKEELADKIKFFLKNESARNRIRIAGRERCLRDHTWQNRFSTVFLRCGLE